MLADRYRIEEVIGRGGMSTVYRGSDTVLSRDVAVKVLLPALADRDPVHVARFEREARAAAALRHSGVVKIYDTGVDSGSHFIVMEYVPGQSLQEILRSGHQVPPTEAVHIAVQVAEALAAAHGAGVLHRDIKPANVMLTPDGTVKVLDFGIARTVNDATLTQTAMAIGTAAYMPPERALGQPGDARSDIYALGCLLFAMLAGRAPFVADETLAVLHQQINTPPPALSSLGVAVPAGLEAVVHRMLAKDPAERPQTAAEVAALLSPHSGVAAAEATAATAVMAAEATAATAVIAPAAIAAPVTSPSSSRHRVATWLAAGAVALVVALLALTSGGPAPHRVSSHHRVAHRATRPRVHHATVATTPSPPDTTPAQTTPPADQPHGHGGVPPGQAKKDLKGPHADGAQPPGPGGSGDGGD